MKPFEQISRWRAHTTSHTSEQPEEKGIIPAPRKHTSEEAPVKLEHLEEPAERLVAKKRPLGSYKSGAFAVDYILPDLEQDSQQDSQQENLALLEEKWAENTVKKRRSINWNIVAAVYACAAVAHTIIVFLSFNSSNKPHPAELTASVTVEQEEQKEAVATVNQLHTTVHGYLNASSVKEKLQWVRHPERVGPLMASHYQQNPLESRKFKTVKNMRAVTAWSTSFILLVAELESGKTQFLTVEHGADDSFKIDWETEVCYQPMAWQDFAMKNTAATIDMRVLARPDNHYNTAFSEDKDYACFRMVSRDSKVPVYGYAKKNSPVWHDLRLFFTGKRQTSSDGEPLILRLRVPENGVAKNGVIIERFLSDRWLYLDPKGGQDQPKAMVASAE